MTAPRAERQAGSDAARASRRFEFTVQNGIGDEATVTINVREDRSPNSYVGFAIANAMRRLPQNRPFRVTSINEVRS